MGKKKRKKNYVMSTDKAKEKLKNGVKSINESYDKITKAQKKIIDLGEKIEKKGKELFKIYHANKDRLPKRITSKYGLIKVRSSPGKVKTLRGFAERIITILDDLGKDSLIRRILSIVFKASKVKIEKISQEIEEIFKKAKIQDYKIELKSELNKDKIQKNHRLIKDIPQIVFEKKKVFSITPDIVPIASLKIAKEVTKEF